MTIIFSSAEQLLAAEGQDLGATEWLAIDQARVNLFAARMRRMSCSWRDESSARPATPRSPGR